MVSLPRRFGRMLMYIRSQDPFWTEEPVIRTSEDFDDISRINKFPF